MSKLTPTKIGKGIKSYREHYGTAQRDVAEAAEISTSYMSLIEAGKKMPPLNVLIKIAAYFETPLSALVADMEAA